MDMFTDVDIFKEVVDASLRGVPVYILLDELHLKSFLKMAENQDVKIQQLRVSIWFKAFIRFSQFFFFFFCACYFFLMKAHFSNNLLSPK